MAIKLWCSYLNAMSRRVPADRVATTPEEHVYYTVVAKVACSLYDLATHSGGNGGDGDQTDSIYLAQATINAFEIAKRGLKQPIDDFDDGRYQKATRLVYDWEQKQVREKVGRLRVAARAGDLDKLSFEFEDAGGRAVKEFMGELVSTGGESANLTQTQRCALVLCHLSGATDVSAGFATLSEAAWAGVLGAPTDDMRKWIVEVACSLTESGCWPTIIRNNLEQLVDSVLLSAPTRRRELPRDRRWKVLHVQGANLRPVRRFERAIQNKVDRHQWDAEQAALAHLDLAVASETLAQSVCCFLNAIEWFLRALQDVLSCKEQATPAPSRGWFHRLQKGSEVWPQHGYSKEQVRHIHALHKAILMWTYTLLTSFSSSLNPPLRLHVAQRSFQVLATACLLAGPSHLEKESSSTVLGCLRVVANTAKLCPVSNPPGPVLVSEADLLSILTRELHCDFMLKLQLVGDDKLPPTLKPHHIAYQLFENNFRGIQDLPEMTREAAMSELLKSRGWTWENVEAVLSLPPPLTGRRRLVGTGTKTAGVGRNHKRLLHREWFEHQQGEREIELFGQKSHSAMASLVSRGDLCEALCYCDEKTPFGCVFSLDQPATDMHYHPFQKLFFKPDSLEGTMMLSTLLHADYLLKELSTGVEVSLYAPFDQRPSQLMTPYQLTSNASSSPFTRGLHHHRDADSIAFGLKRKAWSTRWTNRGKFVMYHVSDIAMKVRCAEMMPDQDGELRDSPSDTHDKDSPEHQFAADFSAHYDRIGAYFPVFLRLKELAKLNFLAVTTHSYTSSLRKATQITKADISNSELESVYREVNRDYWRQIEQACSRNGLDYWSLPSSVKDEVQLRKSCTVEG